MRTEEMVHEIDRLKSVEKQLLKEKAKYRDLWRDAESWKNRLIEALNEILCLPVDSDTHYIIAGNALGQARDRHPAEGEQTRPHGYPGAGLGVPAYDAEKPKDEPAFKRVPNPWG